MRFDKRLRNMALQLIILAIPCFLCDLLSGIFGMTFIGFILALFGAVFLWFAYDVEKARKETTQ